MSVSVGGGTGVLVGAGGKVGPDVGVAGAPQAARTKAVRITKSVKFFIESPFRYDGLSPLFLLCKERANGLRYWQVGGRGLCLGAGKT